MTTLTAGHTGRHVCGIDAAMEVIGGKWKVLILWALHERPAAASASCAGCCRGSPRRCSPPTCASWRRTASCTARSYDEVPPRVEYSLTADGIRSTRHWGRWGPGGGSM